MNQQKIGSFLKELRKQKGITQEQLAEHFGVSNRSVSRWENGNNMPDMDILIEISDYYDVDLREILNGERKGETMNNEVKDTVLQAVDYTNTENEKYNRRVGICNAIGFVLLIVYMILRDTQIYEENQLVENVVSAMQGMAIGMLFVGLIMSSHYGVKIRAFKRRLLRKNK